MATVTTQEHPCTDRIELDSLRNYGTDDDTKHDAQTPSSHEALDGSEEQDASADSSDDNHYPTGMRLWFVLGTLGAVLILTSIDMNVVATAVPQITDDFHTVQDVGWYSSAFRLCMCAFQFMYGKAYTLFSVKRVYLVANIISIAGSIMCGAATSSTMLVIGRAIAGVGAAGQFSGLFVILVQTMPLHRRPMYFAALNAVEGIAILSAPLLGGAIIQSLGWRWCFWINAPVGAVAIALTMFGLQNQRRNRPQLSFKQAIHQMDLISNLLFLPALTSLFLALSWAGVKYPWDSGMVIGPLVTFAVLLTVFIYNQFRRGREAALPPRIMNNRTVIAGTIFIMCINSAGNIVEYYLPTYYQVVRGYSPAKSGLMMLPIVLAGTIGAVMHGLGLKVFGYYTPFMIFASVVMPIAAGLITTLKIHTGMPQLIAYSALSGLAYGIGFSGPQTAVQAALPKEDIPLGLAVILFAQSFGPALTVSIAQVLFTNRLSSNLGDLTSGFSGKLDDKGLSEILKLVPGDKLDEALRAVDQSLIQTWYLVVGLSCATMIGSLSMEWRSVKKKKE